MIKLLGILLGLVFVCEISRAQDGMADRRESMVSTQIAGRGISDEKILAAMRKVPREKFIPEDLKDYAYGDYPVPIGYGQTISQPYIVAYMTQAVKIAPGDRVLEVGTGSGYQAAIIAEIAEEVFTVDIIENLTKTAQKRLEDMGYRNIKFKCVDGYKGWRDNAPFDVIVVTAAPPEMPEELIGQLKTGGRMIVPVGENMQDLWLITKTESGYDKDKLIPVQFVPMI
jgi:protein-L-isoaspartate(D-aspartate) O-methyltransferase